ncbi:MAG TPA: hypothetical protein VD790_04770 [Thermoleophilaceae bacterium]|nr:hypothetical protein [Thermoleophilaceae bacterium]
MRTRSIAIALASLALGGLAGVAAAGCGEDRGSVEVEGGTTGTGTVGTSTTGTATTSTTETSTTETSTTDTSTTGSGY